MVKLLTNPLGMRIIGAAVVAILAMLLFAVALRLLRRMVESSSTTRRDEGGDSGLAMMAYQGVIERLKQQEKELATLRGNERQQASAAEKLNSAILSAIPCGVVVLNRMGIVQLANPAARSILGYASPLGFHARDLFRGISSADGPSGPEALLQALAGCWQSSPQSDQDQVETKSRCDFAYNTPSGESRHIAVALAPFGQPEPSHVVCIITKL